MNTLLYRIGTAGYHTAIKLGALAGVERAKQWVEGRQRAAPLPERRPEQPLVWMHCASLGEWEQGRPVLEAFRKRHPDYAAVLTFFSPSGYERCKDETVADHVAYLPADTPANAVEWIQNLRPTVALFVKYEFWYFHLQALHRADVPTFLVAATFRPDQRFFRPRGGWWRGMLHFFTGIVVQEQPSAKLLIKAGHFPAERVAVAGDPRMDRMLAVADRPFSDPLVEAFVRPARLVIVAGSVWPEDVRALETAWATMPNDVRIILAPHQLHGQEVPRAQVRWKAQRYTRSTPDDLVRARVLLLDTIGMLSRVYRYGDLAYVGGAFRTGLHNTLEPQAYGLPVIFGPDHHKFPEAAAAIAAGGAFSVADGRELTAVLQHLLGPTARRTAAGAQTGLSRAAAGAARKTVDQVAQWIATE